MGFVCKIRHDSSFSPKNINILEKFYWAKLFMCIHVLVRVCIRLHGKCHLNMNIKLKLFAWVCYVQCSKIEQRVCLSSFL